MLYFRMNQEIFVYAVVIAIIALCAYIYFERSDFQLKCVVSTVDGNKYCVRENDKVKESADMLAKVTEKCKKLVVYVGEKFPDQDNVKRLVEGFNPKKVMETLPTSEYTAYSENKGEKLAFCLNTEKNGSTMIDEHTLTFVALHELSHIATKSIGHKTEFWENFKFLLEQAKAAGIHTPKDYKKEPQKYCGMTIRDSPAYDL
jgi:hypothetical protein